MKRYDMLEQIWRGGRRRLSRSREGMSVLSLRAKGSFNMNCVLITEKLGARNAPPLIIIYLGD